MKKWVLGCGGLVGVVLLLAVVVVIGGCGTYNRLVSLQQGTESSWAQVENQYKRRIDLVPNLVQTVQGAANFEKSTLTEVIQARASATQVTIDPANMTPEKLQQFDRAQGQLSSALSRLLVTVERYPELKANANFRDLQAQLEGTENRIAVERQKFNDAVRSYNTAVRQFPGSLVARFGNFTPKPYFQAPAGAENPPKVDFNFGKTTNQ
ncbi:MAG TPA: LemA family protein [Candidatus Acidoferrum sp.]|nr:LemA family protein [Candidatus Acidoferrum sp.]